MATNRKRTTRKPRSRIPKTISEKYRQKLILKDILGMLEPNEIEVARKVGELRWDLWVKADRLLKLTKEQHDKGYLLAPVFDENGEISNYEYPKKSKFLVPDYDTLERLQAEK